MLWAGSIATLDSLRSVARSLGRFHADSAANAGESAVRLAASLAAWALGGGLLAFAVAFVAEAVASVGAFFAWLSRAVPLLPANRDPREAGRFLAESLPLGLAALVFTGFYQLDQVFVRALAGAAASGLYGAAARVVFAANMTGGLVAMAVYPELARHRDDPAAFARQLRAALRLALLLCAGVSAGVLFLAAPFVSVLYGDRFAGAAALLRVLAPVTAVNGVVAVSVCAANALGRERLVLRAAAVLLAVNVALNWLLVPRYGAVAAAWVSLAGEVLMAACVLAASPATASSSSPLPPR